MKLQSVLIFLITILAIMAAVTETNNSYYRNTFGRSADLKARIAECEKMLPRNKNCSFVITTVIVEKK